jgi:hypothetical protein
MKSVPGTLAPAIDDLLQKNLWLQRLHNQDRAILLKQNEIISESHSEPEQIDPVLPSQRSIRRCERPHKHRHDEAFSQLRYEVELLTKEIGHFDHELRKRRKFVRNN